MQNFWKILEINKRRVLTNIVGEDKIEKATIEGNVHLALQSNSEKVNDVIFL